MVGFAVVGVVFAVISPAPGVLLAEDVVPLKLLTLTAELPCQLQWAAMLLTGQSLHDLRLRRQVHIVCLEAGAEPAERPPSRTQLQSCLLSLHARLGQLAAQHESEELTV